MRLKELREKLGYTQMAVESITGVSQSTLSRLELSDNKKARYALMEYAVMQKLLEYEAGRHAKN